MRGVNHQHVNASLDEQLYALLFTRADTHCCADTQAAHIVLAGVGVLARFKDILYRDKTAQFVGLVNHQHALKTKLVHQPQSLFARRAFLHSHQARLGCHDIFYRLVEFGFKAQVAVSYNADNFFAIEHRQAGNIVLARQCDYFAHRHARRYRHRVFHHTTFKALDLGNLSRLCTRRHVLVHNADAALLR